MAMAEGSNKIRLREESLKKKWDGVTDQVPVNETQYSFDTPERELTFQRAQFPTEEEWRRYGEYREEWYRRAKEFDPGDAPLAVICELVSTCNLACPMCYTNTEEFKYSVVGAQRMLPYETVCRVIDECAELGVPSILFSWRGESALYHSRFNGEVKRLPDVFAYARKKGILETTCLTNGQGIDEKMARAIVAAEPSWINFSIDGLGDVYNKVRTPRKYEEALEKVKTFMAVRERLGAKKPLVKVQTLWSAIKNNPEEYLEVMGNIVDKVSYNIDMDFERIHLVPDPNYICYRLWQRLAVTSHGDILKCPSDFQKEQVLGNVESKSIKEIWDTEQQRHRELHLARKRVEDPVCKKCHHGALTYENVKDYHGKHQEVSEITYEDGFEGVGLHRKRQK